MWNLVCLQDTRIVVAAEAEGGDVVLSEPVMLRPAMPDAAILATK